MLCAVIDNGGYVRVVGAVGQVANCEYVILAPTEVSPWSMSVEQASELVVAIGVLWAVAFGIRTLGRFIQYTR